jgi:hypothetical protein
MAQKAAEEAEKKKAMQDAIALGFQSQIEGQKAMSQGQQAAFQNMMQGFGGALKF